MVKVAIAHDYLTQRGGAERVVLALSRAFPDAPVFTLLYEPDETFIEFKDVDVRVSWLNAIGPMRRNHRAALPFLPLAASSVGIDADVTIVSSSGWAHGFRTSGKKLTYCYSPARWLYDSDRYLGDDANPLVSLTLLALRPGLSRWDQRAARSVDKYLAISNVTRERIKRTYGVTAEVVSAPHGVDVDSLTTSSASMEGAPNPGYFLVVARLLPYKNVAAVVEAFRARPDLRLVIVGRGPQKAALVARAGSNVTFLERLTDSEMTVLYAGCVGLIAASHEDFGLTPLEAAAHGKPSAVLRSGGFLDTMREGITAVFFNAPVAEEILVAVDDLSARNWNSQVLKDEARRHDERHFAERIRREVASLAADDCRNQ